MVSSRSEENVNLKHFQHLVVSQCWCVLQFFLGLFLFVVLGRCYCQCLLANIVIFGRCYCHMQHCGRCCTTMSDIITCLLLWCRCCCHMVYIVTCCLACLADVIAIIGSIRVIRVNDPSLNRNIGKYYLPHIWDEVLHKTSELKLKH